MKGPAISPKNSLGFVATSAALILSLEAYAAEVKIDATVEVGAEYQIQLLHTDDGLKADDTEIKEADFFTRAAKIAIRGKLTDQLS